MNIGKWLALGLAGTFWLGMLPAADKDERGFLNRVYKDANGAEAKYVLFIPHDYKGDTPYPVIVFLI